MSRILVVEDEQHLADGLRYNLEAEQYDVDLVDNGEEALQRLTADPSRCLLLYSIAAWEPIEQKLMALSSFNSSTRALQRLLVGHADDVDVDATGRLLVPPALRQYAALDKRIVLVGQGNKFEIWDETRWNEVTAAAVSFSEGGLPPELEGFSL